MQRSPEPFQKKMKHAKWSLILILALTGVGCSALANKERTGIVITRRAQLRSSTALVAADIKEVVRNDAVDILDSNTAENGEQWLHVRTHDAESTEGWLEARNIMPQEMLERSRQLAHEDDGIPAQAAGQLRASTNIRFSPDRSRNDNILMKLESGARFDIVGWKRVPKPKSSETTESDDAPKAGAAQQSEDRRREGDDLKMPEETNELWYKVRLSPSVSPAPAGWVYGKQVELTVPSDIIFYRTGREFVAWQRLDAEPERTEQSSQQSSQGEADSTRDTQPGSWVILEKSSASDTGKPDAPDFDRIYVLGYDKDRQEHYTVYRSPDLEGYLPLRVEEQGDKKIFTLKLQHEGQLKDARYRVTTDDRGLLRIEALDEAAKTGKKR
jgi:hypothetical protein